MEKNLALSATTIEQKIFMIRERDVILDFDLASHFETKTKVLNQIATRNIDQFSSALRFSLSQEEFETLNHPAVPNFFSKRRSLPYAYTQEGVVTIAFLINTPKAIKAHLTLMNAFFNFRKAADAPLMVRMDNLERTVFQGINEIKTLLLSRTASPAPLNRSRSLHASKQSTLELDKIVSRVANFFQIDDRAIKGKSRKQPIALARQIAVYLMRKNLKITYPKLASYLGHADHTAVLHAFEKISAAITMDKVLQGIVKELDIAIAESLDPPLLE
jgi:hypothetical protein